MPSRDWDDSWYDDDEFPPMRQKGGRGGVVTVAVVTIIMCGFNALSATCVLFCGFVFPAVGHGNHADFLPGNLRQHAALILLGLGSRSAVTSRLRAVRRIGLL